MLIKIENGESVLDALRRSGVSVAAPCGGNGTCGKCIVKISGETCLACKTFPKGGSIEVTVETQGEISVLSAYEDMGTVECDRYDSARAYGIAIDLGTTTLAFELLDMRDGTRVAVFSRANSQRVFGADVITRISKAVEGEAEQLNATIIEDIRTGVKEILRQSGITSGEIACVAIAGNTTMLHLLRNLPCNTLGVHPFTPVTVEMYRCDFNEIFGLLNCELIILPGISAFVGADIAAGILFCGWPTAEEASIFIDLGTNGEMALCCQGKILATSTAAGPAFEAGNITHGVGSIPGAIAKVNYLPESNVFMYKTINNKPPVGICGTGVVDITAELVRHRLVDETGLLENGVTSVNITADIGFVQKNIREVQLAKSAVRSGIEILLGEAGLKYSDIGRVFLAGGFGYRIDVENAAVLGLIPSGLKDKVLAVGNATLGGCAKVLLSRAGEEALLNLVSIAEEVNLATHPRFNMLFMEYMSMEWP